MDDVFKTFRPVMLSLMLALSTFAIAGAEVLADGTSGTALQVAEQTPELTEVADQKSIPRATVGQADVSAVRLASATEPLPDATSEAALQAKHETVATELRVALMQKDTGTIADGKQANTEASNVDFLKQIDVTIAQQKTSTATLQDIKAKQAELEVELGKLADNRLDQEPPYSILVLDQLHDSLISGKARHEAIQASLLSAREAVERARVMVEDRKIILRQLKEKSPAEDPKLQPAKLDVRLAEETLVLRRQELAIEEAHELVHELQTQIDEKKVAIVSQQVHFSAETLNEQIAEIDVRENELKRKIASLQSEMQYIERRLSDARQERDSNPTPSPVLAARVDALKTAQQTFQIEETVFNQRLQRLPLMKTSWQRRYDVVSDNVSRQDRRTWIKDAEKQLDLLKRERRGRELKLDELRVTIGSVSANIEAVNGSNPELKRWLEEKHKSLTSQFEIYNDSILAIESAQRVENRLLTQIQGKKGRTPNEWIADGWAATKRIWNYELASVDDTSLTVGKVLSSVLLMCFGYFAANWLSGLLGRRLPKLGVDEAGAHAMQSLSFYTLLIAFALAALKYSSVPLTVFAFLGGAIAIGIGFGSQNILNNFISGLILLAERPIKVGDLISIDATYGNVTQIGARSTQIRTGENLDIIVPNSKFLENNVINLTRRDDRLRTSINVGVSYGSPLDVVIQLLEQAAGEHPGVQARPKPFVWFNDFGDNALAFQVHFWINARNVSAMKKVETEVRLSIDRLFREHGVVIAFPQRDLHIQTPNPLEFRIVGNDAEDDDKSRRAG